MCVTSSIWVRVPLLVLTMPFIVELVAFLMQHSYWYTTRLALKMSVLTTFLCVIKTNTVLHHLLYLSATTTMITTNQIQSKVFPFWSVFTGKVFCIVDPSVMTVWIRLVLMVVYCEGPSALSWDVCGPPTGKVTWPAGKMGCTKIWSINCLIK